MNYFIKLLFSLAFLITPIVQAEINKGPEPNAPGDINIVVVASHSPAYIKEWISTPPKHGVTIKRLKSVRPNQLAVTAFLVSGMSPDNNGRYKFSVSFKLFGPDGKIIFGENGFAKGEGKLPENPSYIMADPALDIVLESTDPEGEYTVVGIVHDQISNKTAEHSYKLTLVK